MKTAGVLSALCVILVVRAQQAPPPKPRPKPRSDPAAKPAVAKMEKGILTMDTNAPCRILVDGQETLTMEAGAVKTLSLFPGRHIVEAFALVGDGKVRQDVDIETDKQDAVSIEFQAPGGGDYRLNRDGLEYARVPLGEFQMGCSAGDRDCRDDELPARTVAITKDYWIARTEVTVQAYRLFAEHTGRDPAPDKLASGVNFPQAHVTWAEAAAYCQEWAGGRLPTEAEWEYAARGEEAEYRFPTGNTMEHADANFSGTGEVDTWIDAAPVGRFPANKYGLFDMAGNVWEWCADWYSNSAYKQSSARDPQGPSNGDSRVIRGGSWNNISVRLRVSNRESMDPATRSVTVGFRCVLELAP